jgi:nucleoside-diphosphate-sugar epimerase
LNLVTGATGIIGSHVVLSLLLDSQPVLALKRPRSDISKVKELFRSYSPSYESLFEKIKWIELDIQDTYGLEAAFEGVKTVYHCAGLVSFDNRRRADLFLINEKGTANVVNACIQAGVEALCHVSTIGTLNNSDVDVLTENVFWKRSGKESYYALSKYGAEREVWRGIEEGLNAVIVNPGVVLSPVYWDQSSGQIFRRCARGMNFYTSGSSAYISAMDASRIMISLVKGRHFGNRYILVENNYEVKTILDRIHRNFGRKAPRFMAGKSVLLMAGIIEGFFRIFSNKSRILTKSFINSALNTQKYSNLKVLKTLDYRFEPVPEVLDKICAYYRAVSAEF